MQRKALWKEIGGYNERMLSGYEDWDYWLSAIEKGWRAKLIPRILLLYRKRESSLLDNMVDSDEYEIKLKMIRNHPELYIPLGPRELETLNRKRRIPEEIINKSFSNIWLRRNRELLTRQSLKREVPLSSISTQPQNHFASTVRTDNYS